MFRIPHCLDNRLRDGGKVVSPTHWPRFTPQKHCWAAEPAVTLWRSGKSLAHAVNLTPCLIAHPWVLPTVKPEKRSSTFFFLQNLCGFQSFCDPRHILAFFDMGLTFVTSVKEISDGFCCSYPHSYQVTIYKLEALKLVNEVLNINAGYVRFPAW
jgi:hypothetical protein